MIDDRKVKFCSCDGRGVRQEQTRPLRGRGMGVQRGVEMIASLSRTDLVCVFVLQLCQHFHALCVGIRSEARPLHKFRTNLQRSAALS